MKKNEIIFAGVIVIILILAGIIFSYSKTIPTSAEVETETNLVKPANKDIFSSKTSQELSERTIFGSLPVEVQDNYNNEDPFF